MSNRRPFHLATFVHSVIHKKDPQYLYDKLSWLGSTHSYGTRSVGRLLAIPKHHGAAYRDEYIESVSVDEERISLALGDGQQLKIEDCWLRDNCRCKICYTQDTFQRALHILDIPAVTVVSAYSAPASSDSAAPSATPAAAASPGNATPHTQLHIIWSDGHASTYDLSFLRCYSYDTWLASSRRQTRSWRGQEVDKLVAHVQLRDFLDTEDGAIAVFKSLLDFGAAFVEGVGTDLKSTEVVCEALGGVQRTLFGGMWQFTSVAEHADTAYTTLPLAPHTDSTYFTESTGLQILHCIEHAGGTGGNTVLVDGFEGAESMRKSHPKLFALLTRPVFEAEYIEKGHHHKHAGPIIGLHPVTGEVQQIRFNVYDRSPASFTSGAECRSYYAALKTLASIYRDPERQWWLKLNPGTILVMDNWRVLHGRSSFNGKRVLCGSYVARSDWLDRARVLKLL